MEYLVGAVLGVAVGGFASKGNIVAIGKDMLQPLTQNRVIVGNQCADHAPSPAAGYGMLASMRVPLPGSLSTSRLPPSRPTRSRMPSMP